jgi:hypothetical protein
VGYATGVAMSDDNGQQQIEHDEQQLYELENEHANERQHRQIGTRAFESAAGDPFCG